MGLLNPWDTLPLKSAKLAKQAEELQLAKRNAEGKGEKGFVTVAVMRIIFTCMEHDKITK
jgi:hypothetical protein